MRIPSFGSGQNDGVLKRLGVILLWLLATIGTVSLTYAAVTQADRAVTDAPAGPVAGADIAARIATTTTAAGTAVTLVSATPVAPYSVDVEDDGPEKVEVEFESGETRYRVRGEVVDGELVWDVSQETEGD